MTSFRQRVRQSGPAKAANPGGINQRVRYLAAPSPYASMEMEVELYKARVGVNGDFRGADTWNRVGQDKPVFV